MFLFLHFPDEGNHYPVWPAAPSASQVLLYTKTTTPHYSKLQNITTLLLPTRFSEKHTLIHMGWSRVGCVVYRFILQNMRQKGVQARIS